MTSKSSSNGILAEAWKASRSGVAAIILFGAFINLLKFAMPLYTLQILDRVPDSRSVETLAMLTVIALLAVVSGVLLESVRRRMLVRWSGWLNQFIGPHLVQSGIDSTADAKNSNTTPSKLLENLETVRSFIEKSAVPLLDLVWIPLFVLTVFLIHPLFGAIMLLTAALRILSGYVQNRVTRPSRQQWTSASREAKSMIDAAERQSSSIGAVAMSQRISEKWLSSIRTKMSEREISQDHDNVFTTFNTGLYRVLYVLGMGFGVWLLVHDLMTIGGVIAVNIIMRFGFRLLDRGVRRWDSLARAKRSYQRLSRQLGSISVEPVVELTDQDLLSPLVLERVTHRHSGHSDSILRKVDLTIECGEVLNVIGRCASGKSTFARLISGSEPPRAGHIRLGDMELSRLKPHQLNSVVGSMSQQARLFSGTVRDNISSLRECGITEVMDAARLAGIHERIIRLPEGYDTPVDDQTHLLSSGECKLVLIARAFFGRPRLIVLDEPEAHLDRPSRIALARALAELKAYGSSIIITSQTSWLGQLTDKTYLLGASRNSTSTPSEKNDKNKISNKKTLRTEPQMIGERS